MTRYTIVLLIAGMCAAGSLSAQTGRRTEPAAAPKPAAPKPAPAAAAAQAPSRLTNQDVLKMVQAGLGEQVVIATVRAAPATSFDLSPDGLIALKQGGVSDAIVTVMIDPKAVAPPAPVAVPVSGGGPPVDTRTRVDTATASPDVPREPGIYWDKGRDGAHDLVALEPTVFSQGKTGGFITSALTYGIKKVNVKAVTRGSAANLHIAEPQPTFYFYFESRGSGLGTGTFAGWLSGATSPNEFVLARVTSKSRDRELIIGELGVFGGNSGTRSKDTIDTHVDRLDGGIYRVRPSEPLEPGEYCFFYAGGVGTLGPGTAGAGKLFDFGIYNSAAR